MRGYELLPSTEQPTKSSWHSRRPRLVFLSSILFFLASLLFALDILIVSISPSSRSTRFTSVHTAFDTLLSHLWPVGMPNRTDSWENENSKRMHGLMSCMVEDTCAENQTSLVLMSSHHFANAISGHVSGEDIWAMSALQSLVEMSYTPIFAPSNYEMARTYRQFPSLVKVIILEASQAKDCFKDPKCIKKIPAHPLGIPAWKMLSFHFWNGPSNPLGARWTLSPEDYAKIEPNRPNEGNFYLGYSIEETCTRTRFVPDDERPNQVYVLAKSAKYFTHHDFAWPDTFSSDAPDVDVDVDIVGGFEVPSDFNASDVPSGIRNLGKLNQTSFYHALSHSRALIGIGNPWLSPSPYDALCMGVPFINPIVSWDKNDPENRTKWNTQHNGLKGEMEPYVYHVRKGDSRGMWDAIGRAVRNPIERYIPPAMTMEALKHRVAEMVEKDWRSMAEEVLEERKASGKGELFEM